MHCVFYVQLTVSNSFGNVTLEPEYKPFLCSFYHSGMYL